MQGAGVEGHLTAGEVGQAQVDDLEVLRQKTFYCPDVLLVQGSGFSDLIPCPCIAQCLGGRAGPRARDLFFVSLSLSPLSLSRLSLSLPKLNPTILKSSTRRLFIAPTYSCFGDCVQCSGDSSHG